MVTGEAATGATEGAVACDPAAPAVQTLPASQAGAPVRASATRTGTEDPDRSRCSAAPPARPSTTTAAASPTETASLVERIPNSTMC